MDKILSTHYAASTIHSKAKHSETPTQPCCNHNGQPGDPDIGKVKWSKKTLKTSPPNHNSQLGVYCDIGNRTVMLETI